MHHYLGQNTYPQEFALHQKYCQSPLLLDLVWTHCLIVADIVNQLFEHLEPNQELDQPLAIQAALLHDIGVYDCGGFEWLDNSPPKEKPYVQHAVVGAWILQQEGYHSEVVQTANVHVGVGLTKQEVTEHGLQLPADDYLPTTPLQQLVTYAAKFHSKTPKFRTSDEIEQTLAVHGKDKVKTFQEFKKAFGEPEIDKIIPKYAEWHKAFQFKADKITNPGTATTQNVSSAGISQL